MKTTEVVIYKIKDKEVKNFAALSELADQCLVPKRGFISRQIMKDHTDPSIFMDIVEWASLDDAKNAATEIEGDPAIQPFFDAAEKVISFNHYYRYGL